MLAKLDNGHTEFKLDGTTKYTLDFVDDIPFEWVRQAIYGLESENPFCVVGKTDSGKIICVVGWDCHIIWEKAIDLTEPGGIGYECVKVNVINFCNMLYSDIKDNISDWVDFGHPENVDERRDELEKLLERLKELIENNEQTFKY